MQNAQRKEQFTGLDVNHARPIALSRERERDPRDQNVGLRADFMQHGTGSKTPQEKNFLFKAGDVKVFTGCRNP